MALDTSRPVLQSIGAYDLIDEGSPAFSPDSKHVALTIRDGEEWRLVVDGSPAGEEYDDLHGPLVFSTPARFHVMLERDQEVLRAEGTIVAS